MTAITKEAAGRSATRDTITTDDLQAFFDIKEQFFYYRQFSNPSRRRDFAPSFVAAVERFLNSTTALEAIYEHYVRPRAGFKRARSPVALLQGEWNRFPEFFDEAATTELAAAKAAYRRAAKALHPDAGGDPAEMVALNAAFAQLLDILMLAEVEATMQPQTNSGNDRTRRETSFACGFVSPGFWPGSVLQYPRSAQEFEILLRSEALLAAIDIFEEDHYADLALGLHFNSAWAVEAGRSWEAFDKACACERVANILRIVMEATRGPDQPYGLPGLRDLARVWLEAATDGWIKHGRLSARETASAKKVQEREEKALLAGHYPFVDEWREKSLRALASRLDRPGSRSDDRFQLNHMLQAENAFRRGLITSTRYKTTVERLEGKREELAAASSGIVHLSKSAGFMALEHDPVEAEQNVSVRFVPESVAGSAFGNWRLDSKQACRAYGEAYYRSDQIEGKLKFVRQRLWILLSSLIANPARWDAARIEAAAHEVQLLQKAARAGREGQADSHAAELHVFLTELAAEAAPSREDRLEILARIASEDFRDSLPSGVSPVLTGVSPHSPISGWSPLTHVVPSSSYYRAAMLPLGELKKFAAGKAWTDPEQEARQRGVEYYYEHMGKLSDRMFKAADIEPAEKKITKLAPLIREAIDQSVPLEAAGEWQLGYYIDRLTGAMVRARKFAEAAAALEEYFALPDAYRTRSTASGDKTLAARLTRCQRDRARPE